MGFSETTLTEIKSRSDIVDVIGRYVNLKKSGQGYQGLCPFHSEKTPSFHVHPIKQVYRCFGSCNKGGNVFTFLMEHEGISFPEAVRRLAKDVGVKIEEDKTFAKKPAPKPLNHLQERALAALEWASKYFNHLLTKDPQFVSAKKYLENRGLSQKSIERFQLGVSPKGWSTLIQMMTKRGFTWDELLTAGLVVPKDDGKHQGYDRFRERLMFPIKDKQGAVIGFGARALKEGDEPKYLNSPDTPLFNKSKILYGLFENQREIRLQGEALVVEGYMDVVGLAEAGVKNAVAPMGTALTPEHCRELKSFSQKVITVFDPDAAGINAWHRSISLFLEAGLVAKDVSLPNGLDPDEFVKKEGSEKFYSLCNQAPQQVTKFLKEVAEKGPLGEKERAQVLNQLTPVLISSKRLPDKGALLWDDVSRLLNISFDGLQKLIQDTSNRFAKPTNLSPVSTVKKNPSLGSPRKKKFPLDWEFFRMALKNPGSFFEFPKENWVGVMKEPELETLLLQLWETQDPNQWMKNLEALVAHQTCPEILDALSEVLVHEEPQKLQDSILFKEVAKRLSERRQRAQIQGLAQQVRLSQRLGEEGEQIKLLEQLKNLKAQSLQAPPKSPLPEGGPKTGLKDH